MATREEVIILVFFAFMVIFLMFLLRRARTRPILDLLECSVGAQYFLVIIVYSRMWRFLQRLWWIEPK